MGIGKERVGVKRPKEVRNGQKKNRSMLEKKMQMLHIVISSKLRVGHIRLRNVELGNELRMKLRMKTLG